MGEVSSVETVLNGDACLSTDGMETCYRSFGNYLVDNDQNIALGPYEGFPVERCSDKGDPPTVALIDIFLPPDDITALMKNFSINDDEIYLDANPMAKEEGQICFPTVNPDRIKKILAAPCNLLLPISAAENCNRFKAAIENNTGMKREKSPGEKVGDFLKDDIGSGTLTGVTFAIGMLIAEMTFHPIRKILEHFKNGGNGGGGTAGGRPVNPSAGPRSPEKSGGGPPVPEDAYAPMNSKGPPCQPAIHGWSCISEEERVLFKENYRYGTNLPIATGVVAIGVAALTGEIVAGFRTGVIEILGTVENVPVPTWATAIAIGLINFDEEGGPSGLPSVDIPIACPSIGF